MAHVVMRWCQGSLHLHYCFHQQAKRLPLFRHSKAIGHPFTSSQNHRHFSKVIQTCYETLEVSPKATSSQIKAAYYRLSKKYHPDMNQSQQAKEKFAEISEAYEILGSKQSRRQYDLGLGQAGASRTRRMNDDPYGAGIGKHRFKARTGPMMGKTKFYDFDKFYKEHYGESLKESQAGRDAYTEYLRLVNEVRDASRMKQLIYMVSMGTFIFGYLVARAKRLKKF